MKRYGSEYGGYMVPDGVLTKDSIVYSAGLGEDGTFDVAIAGEFGCRVRIFDPTPRAKEYFEANLAGYQNMELNYFGIWLKDTIMPFYVPRDQKHVSHSVGDLQSTGRCIYSQIHRLATIMETNGDTRIDLLKMDIEGAEYDVIQDMIISGIKPGAICVELHQPRRYDVTFALEGYGYQCVYGNGSEYTYKLMT